MIEETKVMEIAIRKFHCTEKEMEISPVPEGLQILCRPALNVVFHNEGTVGVRRGSLCDATIPYISCKVRRSPALISTNKKNYKVTH